MLAGKKKNNNKKKKKKTKKKEKTKNKKKQTKKQSQSVCAELVLDTKAIIAVLKSICEQCGEHHTEQWWCQYTASDTEATFLELHLSVSNEFVSSKIYDKREDFDFDKVNFLFLDGTVPRSTSYGLTFLSWFGLLDCLVKWLISMPIMKV